MQGSGFRVPGARRRVQVYSTGCRLQGAGFRVQVSGCRFQGAGCRVQGSACRVQRAGFGVQGAGFGVQGAGFRVQGSGVRGQVWSTGFRVQGAPLNTQKLPAVKLELTTSTPNTPKYNETWPHGNLTHKKPSPPEHHHRAVGIVLPSGPKGGAVSYKRGTPAWIGGSPRHKHKLPAIELDSEVRREWEHLRQFHMKKPSI